MTNEAARGVFAVRVHDPMPDASIVVELEGELDLASRPILTRSLQPIIVRGCPRLVLDLAGLGFIDGSGMGVLLDAARALARHGGVLVLRAVPHVLDVILDATATRSMFRVEPPT